MCQPRSAILRATGTMSLIGAPSGRRVPKRTPRMPAAFRRFRSSGVTEASSIAMPRAVGPSACKDCTSRLLSITSVEGCTTTWRVIERVLQPGLALVREVEVAVPGEGQIVDPAGDGCQRCVGKAA